jgi:ketosteroid isomerase-like protein
MDSHPHQQLLEDFYRAFNARNGEAMARCYHDEVVFSDPAFPRLSGGEVADMWRMLLARAKGEFSVELVDATADSDGGQAEWTARYTFSQTGRLVENHILSRFAFRDGLIVRQHDTFDFWKWSRMALGAKGALLGWSPLLKRIVRNNAAKALAGFRAR